MFRYPHKRQENSFGNPDQRQSATRNVRLADPVPKMVERRTNPRHQRTDRPMRTDSSSSHDASDRAPIPAGLYLAITSRVGFERSLVSRTERPTPCCADLPQLALSSRRQSFMEREVSTSRHRRYTQEEVFTEITRYSDVAMEGRVHAATCHRDELEEQADQTAKNAERTRRSCDYVFTVLRESDREWVR